MGAGASKNQGSKSKQSATTTFLTPDTLGLTSNNVSSTYQSGTSINGNTAGSASQSSNGEVSSVGPKSNSIAAGGPAVQANLSSKYRSDQPEQQPSSSGSGGAVSTSGAGFLTAKATGSFLLGNISPNASSFLTPPPSTMFGTRGNPPSPSQRSMAGSATASLSSVSLKVPLSDTDVASMTNASLAAGSIGGGANNGWRLDANTLFPQLRIRNGISATAMSLREMSISQLKGIESMSTNEIFSERIIWAAPCNYSFTTCGGQSGPIRSISSSADGSQFAVVVAGVKQCFITDAATGKVTVTIKGHLDPVLSCSQSKDGKFLVTTSADCTVVLWDMTNGKKLREVPVNFQANVCAVSDDSEIVATTSTEDFVHLWDARQCEPLYTFTRHSATIFSVGFCRKGNLFASGATNGEVMVWSYPTGEVRAAFNKHRSSVLAVSFSHDGRRLCTIDKECVRCWDLFTNHCVFARDIRGNVTVGPHTNDDRRGTGPQAADETVRFLSCAMIACNLIVVTQSNRFVLVIDPNRGSEILSIQTRAIATAIGSNFNGDTVFIGDMHGNQYKLKLQFLPRDVKAFNLNAKPFTKEKNAKID